MDYKSYCELFYSAHYLPIAIYQNNAFYVRQVSMKKAIPILLFFINWLQKKDPLYMFRPTLAITVMCHLRMESIVW